jgi:hypothetical protein
VQRRARQLRLARYLVAAHVRHGEVNDEQFDIGFLVQDFQRFLPSFHRDDGMAGFVKQTSGSEADHRIVVEQQDACRFLRCLLSWCSVFGSARRLCRAPGLYLLGRVGSLGQRQEQLNRCSTSE